MFVRKFSAVAVATAAVMFAAGTAVAQEELSTDKQKFSYSVGFQIANQVMQRAQAQGVEFDSDAFLGAMTDVMNGAEPKLTPEEMQQVMEAQNKEQEAAMAAAAGEAKAAGDTFREEYKAGEGVETTESGLAYKVLASGEGKTPTAESTVKVHYVGKLTDGTEFDSSVARGEPAEFGVTGVIPGWTEIVQLMKEGDKWEVVIPSELAYGERGAGASIPPNSTLVFEIELLEVK